MPAKITFPTSLKKAMVKQGMDLRMIVLHYSLELEMMIRVVIAQVENKQGTNDPALGYGSKAMSFNDLMERLIKMKVMDNKHRQKLQWFAQIRNQLVHNWHARTVGICLIHTPQGGVTREKLLKAFPPPDEVTDKELRLLHTVVFLCDYVRSVTHEIMVPVKKKILAQMKNPPHQ